jgi:hypothetical protein
MVPAAREREERLRRGRLEAGTLRDRFPSASLVSVELIFDPATELPHAPQSFALYPAARAFFWYPCPYGDCDGVFDLSVPAERALENTKPRVSGVLECTGVRVRDRRPKQPCGLRVNYSISAKHERKA